MKKINDLGNDSVMSLVFKLTVPAMFAQFVNVLYGIIDRMFIGNIPDVGHIALAGVGVCGPIVTLLSSFGTLVGIGGSVIAAIAMGRKDDEDAKQIISNSFLLLTVFSVVLTIIFMLTKNQMIYMFGGSDRTFEYADAYLTYYTPGTFFALCAMGLNFFITCQGFSINGMITVFIGAVSNIILDAIFVRVMNWGITGAAVATVISQFFSFLYALLFLLGKKIKIKLSFGHYSIKKMLQIIKTGISPFIILSTDSILIIAMNAALQIYGGEQGDLLISAVTVIQSYFLLITGPLIGISGGVQPIISYNFGAAQPERVKKTVKYALIFGILFTGSMFVVSHLLGNQFVSLFTSDAQTAQVAVKGIKIFTLAVVPLAFQYVLVDALTALGRVGISLYLSASRKTMFLILIFVYASSFEAQAAFFAQPTSDLICAIQSTAVFIPVFKSHLKRIPVKKKCEEIKN